MMYWLVTNHRLCIDMLNRDFYTVGLYFKNIFKVYPKHYSGNFWWANSEYLKLLTPIKKMNNRMNAEMILFTKYQQHKHINLVKKDMASFLPYLVNHEINPTNNPYLEII